MAYIVLELGQKQPFRSVGRIQVGFDRFTAAVEEDQLTICKKRPCLNTEEKEFLEDFFSFTFPPALSFNLLHLVSA